MEETNILLDDFATTTFDFVFEYSSALLMLKDEHNQVLKVNQRLADLAQTSKEAIEGKHVSCLAEKIPAYFLTDETELLSSTEKNTLDIKAPSEGGGFMYLRATKTPVIDQSTNKKIVFIEALDISKEVLIEQQSKIVEERLKVTSLSANVALWEVKMTKTNDDINRHFWWSETFTSILGYEDNIEPCEQNFMKLMHPEDAVQISLYLESLLQKREGSIDFTLRLNHRSKGYRWFKSIGYKNQVKKNLYRSIGVIIDIHDLKTTERALESKTIRLEQSIQDLEHFAYSASHDLKAPLRGIKNLAIWIEEDMEKSVDVGIFQNLNLMKKRVLRMENLLADMLAYSRAGKRSASEDIDIANIIEEIWDCLDGKEKFELKLDISNQSIKASQTLIEQVFSNLISNAIKHHNKPFGSIQVIHQITQEHHHFSVIDDGPGIDERFQNKVFELFQTLRPRDELEGSGVGLAIVRKSLNMAGGKIWIESDASGSSFHFTLPLDESTIA